MRGGLDRSTGRTPSASRAHDEDRALDRGDPGRPAADRCGDRLLRLSASERQSGVARPRSRHRPALAVHGARRSAALNMLLIGSEERAGRSAGDDLDTTTILLHVSADRGRLYGISIPPDLLISRPECPSTTGDENGVAQERRRVPVGYLVGGEGCVVRTVETMTNIRSTTSSSPASTASRPLQTRSMVSRSRCRRRVLPPARRHDPGGRIRSEG